RAAAREIGSARDYHSRAEADASIDDRTWADLDLDEVFLTLDRTASQVGRQYLYHLLRTPSNDRGVLEQRDAAAIRLAQDPELAERIRNALNPLGDDRSAQLVYLMFGTLPPRPRFAWIFVLLTISSIGFIVAVPFWPRAFIAWVAVCVANVGVLIIYKPRLQRFV